MSSYGSIGLGLRFRTGLLTLQLRATELILHIAGAIDGLVSQFHLEESDILKQQDMGSHIPFALQQGQLRVCSTNLRVKQSEW